jgi:hypothetical protein
MSGKRSEARFRQAASDPDGNRIEPMQMLPGCMHE